MHSTFYHSGWFEANTMHFTVALQMLIDSVFKCYLQGNYLDLSGLKNFIEPLQS